MTAFLFLRDLLAGIRHTKVAAEDLAQGKVAKNGVIRNFHEIDGILRSIEMTHHHFQAYESFAEQIKQGNLTGLVHAASQSRPLGRRVARHKANLISIR